ncbi:MAG: prolipoprotein diacylglyceryl transferase [Clostridia bacterium]|nr:prolipoprotein diacylglyceryl transferase [Clostridia bacterium]
MNVAYFGMMIVGAVVCTALFAGLLNQKGMKASGAVWMLPLAAALGFACAKAVYCLLMVQFVGPRYGLGALVRMEKGEFSFFGGCAGVLLGAALAGRITRQNRAQFLDAFAPAGALMVCFARASEYYLGEFNIPSDEIETEFFHRFPFAITNEWEEWYAALFMLAALFALIVFVLSLCRKQESRIDGLRIERTIFYLCLPQVFCESLRSDGIMWGFVRAEQVLCGLCMFALLLIHCRAAKEKGKWKTYWPLYADLGCILVMVFVEFNLDKTFVDIPSFLNYGLMWLALLGIAGCECFCVRRRMKRTK